ncbi:transposase [Thermobifida halotolerans]|uniref:transposase n=1 Tax=Thermobifida halotolerans TaxID=483545 RepID=UPI001F1615A2|nr:transposase [Thermobifida halotolerans]
MCRTWAPVGQTPVLHVVKGRPATMSMAAVCCYHRGHGSRTLFCTCPGWYHDRDLVVFLDRDHQVLDAPVILVGDRLAAHRSRWTRAAIEAREWLEVEYLPSHTPEPNPVENVWSPLKDTALANLAALSFAELGSAVRSGLRRLRYRPDLVDGFLAHTELQLGTK